jgi:8-oxo-dGTP pyrophosphatase MutT (NUDIX family)
VDLTPGPERTILHENEWLSLYLVRRPSAGVNGYVYSRETRCAGRIVAVLPFADTSAGRRYLVKSEMTPCWSFDQVLSAITGGYEGGDIEDDAVREMLEETGYAITRDELIPLGWSYASKSADTVYSLFSVDLTGREAGEAIGDGSRLESESAAVWLTAERLAEVADPQVSVMYLRLHGLAAYRAGGWIEGEPPRNDGELPSGIEIEVRGSFRLTVGNINQMGGSCDDCQGDFDGITRWRKLDPEAAYRAGLQAANNAITWNTTCLNCSALLDIGIREREAGYREGREDTARDIAEAIDNAGSYAIDCLCYGHAAAIARELRVPDCGHEYHGADGGPCPRCGFDVADQANQPRTPLAAETTDTESSPEVER